MEKRNNNIPPIGLDIISRDIDNSILDYNINFTKTIYAYNDNYYVPRVTLILESCTDNSGLQDWAGRMYPKAYIEIKESALRVGKEVHNKIDNFLLYKSGKSRVEEVDYLDPAILSDTDIMQIEISYNNFKKWYDALYVNGFKIEEVYGLEIPIITPWYGGTIDGIVTINGYRYIVDFKTSRKINNNYLIQTAAYRYAVNNCNLGIPRIDGIGIIRCGKNNTGDIEDLFLLDKIPEQSYIITQLENTFCSMVETYYNSFYSGNLIGRYRKNYDTSIALGMK